tara:strand:- start:16224 stop:16598 length:375 start_codon:yes stop_codon:yes gene_type:complete
LFENYFSEKLNKGFSTSVFNGTVALHLALKVFDIKDEDEVIVPTFTYIASVNSIQYCGAKPVFVDSCMETWNININEIKRKITSKTKAILAVHLYGSVCDLCSLRKICDEHSLFLIEDVAEALG